MGICASRRTVSVHELRAITHNRVSRTHADTTLKRGVGQPPRYASEQSALPLLRHRHHVKLI